MLDTGEKRRFVLRVSSNRPLLKGQIDVSLKYIVQYRSLVTESLPETNFRERFLWFALKANTCM